ncbi:MAG: hypothetical protein C0403_01205 [Desulfobacterium sp.]|nr:hypothetical protein [Desulfobacterium sp.]
MKNNESIIKEKAKGALLECLGKIPFLKIKNIREDIFNTDIQADLDLAIELSDRNMRLICEIKNSGQPRLAREASNQILRYREKTVNAYFVFIAPYISSKAAAILKSDGIGYIDLSGNCLLSFDKIFIERKDFPNQFQEKRALRTLYSSKAERVLRVLLCNPGRKWKITELAEESDVSLGQASNVKKILYERELLSGERGSFGLVNPAELLQEWADNYSYRKNEIKELYSLKPVQDIETLCAHYFNKNDVKYALAGFSGAARISTAVRYNKAMIYASDVTEKMLSDLSIKKVGSGGNVLLYTPYDDGVYYGGSKADDIQLVSKVQLFLDLQGFRGRGEEAAELLFERIIGEEW